MELIITTVAIGGAIGGFLIGLACNGDVKALNDELNDMQAEVDRQADVIARYQAKAPERTADGKFASKRKRVTAELQSYFASKKAA